MSVIKILLPEASNQLFTVLQKRFENNPFKLSESEWKKVQAKLIANPLKLWSLSEMERTGGEPNLVGQNEKTGEYLFFDCAVESPSGRRSCCYDKEALNSRKEHKPKLSALGMASDMGIELLTETQYRTLQQLGNFDTKTSSWIKTPAEIRKLGGALFADRRYNTVFVYHNGASSYYSSRGFRGCLAI